MHQDAIALVTGGEFLGGQVADPLHLDRRHGQVAAIASVPDQTRRSHATQARPQQFVPLGQLVGQTAGAFGPERLLGADGDGDLRLGDGDGCPEPVDLGVEGGGCLLYTSRCV